MTYKTKGQGKSKREMVKRIDYLGSLTLVLGVSLELALLLSIICTNIVFSWLTFPCDQLGSLLFALSLKNDRNEPWSSPYVWVPLIVFAISTIAFVSVEAFYSAEPVMPLR